MTALLFLFFIFTGSTVFLSYWASRNGTSGGRGALVDLCPIEANFPVRKS